MSVLEDVLKVAEDLKKGLADTNKRIDEAQSRRNTGAVPASPPAARIGENIMGSRGFRFGKMLACIGNPNEQHLRDDCKIELEFCDRIARKMHAYGYASDLTNGRSSALVPIWPEAFREDQITDDEYREMHQLIHEGVRGADWDEMAYHGKRFLGYRGKAATAATPSQSWIDTSIGGGFVPPPTFGPPIELLRNTAAMLRAGATTMPLGPSGRVQMPRLTSATQGGWSGENVVNNPVNAGTGLMTLSAKKAIALVAFPNELLRFGSPAAEAMIRNDLFLTVSLIVDKGCLDGPGSDNIPLGLATMGAQSVSGGAPAAGSSGLNTAGVNVITPTNTGQLAPQDFYEFLAAIASANGIPTSWIMHPKLFYAACKARWTPYSGGTSQGGFTMDMMRSLADDFTERIVGKPAVLSTQVSKTRGSGAQTYIICMNGPDYILGMFGAIEFTQSNQGLNLVSADQTLIRAILTADGGPRHPGEVAFCDSLNFSVAG